MSSRRVLAFIPMYNCGPQISRVIHQFASPNIQRNVTRIMVVDNGSKDNGLEEANFALQRLGAIPYEVVRNKENYSLGGSHKVAFNYALENDFSHVVVLHGDDQGNIEDALLYFENGDIDDYDCILGSRFHSKSTLIGYSRFRTFGNIVFNNICSVAARCKISDMGSGLNIYRRSFLQDKSYLKFPNDLTFNVFLLLYGIWRGSKIKFFPLTWREDDQVSNARIFRQAWIILKLVMRYKINADKLFNHQPDSNFSADYQYQTIAANDDVSNS